MTNETDQTPVTVSTQRSLFLAVMTKVVPGTIAGVTTGGAQPPRARRFVLAGVQRARIGAVVAIEACQKEGNTGQQRLRRVQIESSHNDFYVTN